MPEEDKVLGRVLRPRPTGEGTRSNPQTAIETRAQKMCLDYLNRRRDRYGCVRLASCPCGDYWRTQGRKWRAAAIRSLDAERKAAR
jgi:hypothetical protein